MIEEEVTSDMNKPQTPDLVQSDPCKITQKMTKDVGVAVNKRYYLRLVDIQNERQATISISDPFSDELGKNFF